MSALAIIEALLEVLIIQRATITISRRTPSGIVIDQLVKEEADRLKVTAVFPSDVRVCAFDRPRSGVVVLWNSEVMEGKVVRRWGEC